MKYILYLLMSWFSPRRVSDALNRAETPQELDELLR